jgi:tRNA modification GTPase
MYKDDTIAAISTAQGTGGIGIIRVSGYAAFKIAEIIFKGKKPFNEISSHTLSYGKIYDEESSKLLDEVLLSKMKGPDTFTKEDIIEINCHGGIITQKNILELVVRCGARLAEPGEFTKRAFLNGRIDLSQAEAVIDLINSKTNESSKAAVDQLEGRLSNKIKEVRNKLIELIAHIEVTFDYPEHDIEEITGQKVYKDINCIRVMLKKLIESFEMGRVLREGINVVIVGKPNVGKSSLLNELAGKNKAIVTDVPGTTRDIIEEYINIKGIPVRIIDTAGIRETEDVVEKIGVEKAEKAIENSDLIVMMLDASCGILEEDLNILKKIEGKKSIILLNKVDLEEDECIDSIVKTLDKKKIIKTSIKEEKGIDELEKEILDLFIKGEINSENEILVTNIRHKTLIDKAILSITEACAAYESNMPLDCISIDIKNAAEYLGEITGESVNDDVLHEIFSRFCIGK